MEPYVYFRVGYPKLRFISETILPMLRCCFGVTAHIIYCADADNVHNLNSIVNNSPGLFSLYRLLSAYSVCAQYHTTKHAEQHPLEVKWQGKRLLIPLSIMSTYKILDYNKA